MTFHLRAAAVIVLLSSAVGAAQQAVTRPSATFSATRLARVDAVLQEHVDANRIAGAVALVFRDGKPIYERAFGWSDKEAGRRMTTDTIFRIASQTKAITSVAVLMLMEEGRLTLNMPVSEFIPGFREATVAVKS
jgi:CubicO group peptidase (beta-lactamase class C family)